MAAGETTEPTGGTLTFKGKTLFSGTSSPISWTGVATVTEADDDNWIAYTGTMADEITALTSLTGNSLVFANSTLGALGAPAGDSGLAVGPVSGSAGAATDTISYSFASAVPAGNSFLLWAPGALYGSYNGPFTYTFTASLDGHSVSTAGWTFSVQSPGNTAIPFTDTINPTTGAITISNYTNGNFAVIIATPNNAVDAVSVTANTIEEDAWGLAFSNVGATPAPTNLALSPASDTGTKGDDSTSDTTPTITGDGQAGDTVTLYSGGTTVLGQAIVASNGTWSVTTNSLASGSYSLTATEADSAGDVSASSTALALIITNASSTVGFFNNTFMANVSAAYKANIVAAEDDIISRWSAPAGYQINLQFDAAADGQGNFLAENSWSDTIDVTYAQLTSALAAHDGGSIYAQDAVASLPAVDPNPQGGADWGLPVAYARMLGLTTQTPTIDDTITLNTSFDWTYGQDVTNTLEHEISEGGMGRVGGLGDQNAMWSTMDLFRYTAGGLPDYQDGRDGVTTYFSYDGGAQTSASADLSFHNEYNAEDQRVDSDDTADFDQSDVFGTGDPGETNTLSATDVTIMDALGWTPVTHVAPTVDVQNVSVAVDAAIAASLMITGVSNPSNDSVTAYEFIDEGGDGGYFTVNGVTEPDNQRIEVLTNNLSSIQYVGASSPGSETLEVGVYDFTTNSYSGYSTLTATTTAPSTSSTDTSDFNGDGKSDILWQYEDTANPSDPQNGDAAIWLMNGTSATATPVVATPPPDWHAIATGDFNGDGKADILWQYEDPANPSDPQNGNAAIWLMNGTSPTATPIVATAPPDWRVIGTGDFNGDGKSDILWQYEDTANPSDPQNGNAAIWLMNGTTPTATTVIATPPPDWHAIATGDFNGDGKSDILWQYEDTANPSDPLNGEAAIWLMNGTTPTATTVVAAPPPDWRVIGTGDFNGDGKSDILWQYEDPSNPSDPLNGDAAIWLMNGTTATATTVFATPPAAWDALGTGDFNGDGKSDIIWQYENTANPNDPQNGAAAIWLMNGTTPTATPVIATPPPSWHVIPA